MLVEGNTDALMAHQQGFDNVVGTLGTALTAGQVELRHPLRAAHRAGVRRRCRRPGRRHIRRDGALGAGRRDRAQRPPGPADRRRRRAPARRARSRRGDARRPRAWRTATAEPQPIVEYLIDTHAKRHDPRTIVGPREARRRGDADDPPRHQPRPSATATCRCSPAAAASRSACCSRSCAGPSRPHG